MGLLAISWQTGSGDSLSVESGAVVNLTAHSIKDKLFFHHNLLSFVLTVMELAV